MESSRTPLQTGKGGDLKLTYTHDNMIDFMLTHPEANDEVIAAQFGKSKGWVRRVTASDAFLAAYSLRKSEIIDPSIIHTTEEKMRAVTHGVLDLLKERLDKGVLTTDQLITALGIVGKSAMPTVAIQDNSTNSFVVMVPPKAKDADSWLKEHHPDNMIEGSVISS